MLELIHSGLQNGDICAEFSAEHDYFFLKIDKTNYL